MRVDRHQHLYHGWSTYPSLTYSPRNKGVIRPYCGKPMANKPLILVSQHESYTNYHLQPIQPPIDCQLPACITAGSAVRTTVGTLVSSSKSYHPTTQKSTPKAANLHPTFAGGFFSGCNREYRRKDTSYTSGLMLSIFKNWGFLGGKSKHFCDFSLLNLVPLREICFEKGLSKLVLLTTCFHTLCATHLVFIHYLIFVVFFLVAWVFPIHSVASGLITNACGR